MSTSLPKTPAASEGRYNRPFGRVDKYAAASCKFWDNVGACRHGSKCAKLHNRPLRSKTVMFWKIYNNPVRTYYSKSRDEENRKNGEFVTLNPEIDEEKLRQEANRLYQDLFVELSIKFGEVSAIVICGNYNLHLGGNVLVKFKSERSAAKCFAECNDRWYNGKPIFCDLSPVKFIDDAICKDYANGRRCERGDQCNLIHARNIEPSLVKMLNASQRAYYKSLESVE